MRRCVFKRADALFKRVEAAFGLFLSDTGLSGQFAHDFKFFAADNLERGQHFIHTIADNGVNFLAHACQGGNGATRHTGKVVKEAGSISHGRFSIQSGIHKPFTRLVSPVLPLNL
jgi:hypothetical protein